MKLLNKLMLELPIKNVVTLIDACNLEKFKLIEWGLVEGYVSAYINGKRIYMHRLVVGLLDNDKRLCDHVNRNRLDNRLENLRIVTNRENCLNRTNTTRIKHDSTYRGVCKISTTNGKPFQANATFYSLSFNLYCGSDIECAYAYNCYAKIANKELAVLNLVDELLTEEIKQSISKIVLEKIERFRIKNWEILKDKKRKLT